MATTDMGNQRSISRRVTDGYSDGFTIIEVILFLAITGLLLTGALIGVSSNINNSRFNDAIRSTTSYLQGQYSEVAAGQSDRDASKGCDASGITPNATTLGMTDCVIMGRYIKLQGSTFTVRYITGYLPTLLNVSDDDTASILQMSPRVAGDLVYHSDYAVPWDIGLVNTSLDGASPASVSTGLMIIRSPASGNILYYTVPDVTSSEPPLDDLSTTPIRGENLNKTAELCFADTSSSRVGRIKIMPGRGQEVIQTDLANTGACPS